MIVKNRFISKKGYEERQELYELNVIRLTNGRTDKEMFRGRYARKNN